jgi:GGDEF domain-containing protein
MELEVRPDLRIPMLISAGAAVFPHDGETYEALLAKADSRMYRDKRQRKSGRATPRTGETALDASGVHRNRAAI